jgi:hypothetical protein
VNPQPELVVGLVGPLLGTAALLASQRVATDRRSESKTEQENRVEEVLLGNQFTKVPTRTVNTSAEAPQAGQFCRESTLAGRKADVLVGLWDTRLMPIECKVSNSVTNSIKRLNNDAAVKAVSWRQALGEASCRLPDYADWYQVMSTCERRPKGLAVVSAA